MCLRTLDDVPVRLEGFGWKAFKDYGGGVYGPLIKNTYERYKENVWVEATDRRIILIPRLRSDEPVKDYTAGFHIPLHKREANCWDSIEFNPRGKEVVRRVEFRCVTASGYQSALNTSKTVIALQMRILPENEIVLEYC